MHGSYEKNLDLNLLRVFVVVAEEGSVTRAAARLYLTQPAISAAMRRLTAFVGKRLLAREGRGVVLTARGRELFERAQENLGGLVSAALALPPFDPATSTASIRLGLGDGLEMVFLPELLRRLRQRAPRLQLIVRPVHFRSVEEQLLERRVDLALGVADEMPRSIVRQRLADDRAASTFVVLHDPRFVQLPRVLTEAAYFAHEHVVGSYMGDARGIVEDLLGKSRTVRVSVPAFSYVADVVDGSPLLATLPVLLAARIRELRPHLRTAPLPFLLDAVGLDLLWSRASDEDAALRFVRELLAEVVPLCASRASRRATPAAGGRRSPRR